MNRYLMLLGVAIIVFGIAGGSLQIANSYNRYQSHVHISGAADTNPLSVLDEAQWQFARLVGGAIIIGGLISGSILMALAWIGQTLEELRAMLAENATPPAKVAQNQP